MIRIDRLPETLALVVVAVMAMGMPAIAEDDTMAEGRGLKTNKPGTITACSLHKRETANSVIAIAYERLSGIR